MGPFGGQGGPSTLFIQILDWMLVPLVIVWPATLIGTYFAITNITEASFDRELRELASAVAAELRSKGTAPIDDASLPVLSRLRLDPHDRLYVQVITPEGSVVAGDWVLPPPPEMTEGDEMRFRAAFVEQEEVRIAWRQAGTLRPLVIQVAEPVAARKDLVSSLTTLVIGVLIILVPITVGLVSYGLHRGLRPLSAMRARVEARDADDLSPLPPGDVPLEIAPLVATLNRQLERVGRNLEAQRRFVADAAHQMRTPLAGLKTQAQAALRGGSVEEARARLAQIEQSADRLGRLSAQLLALARADDAIGRAGAREPIEVNATLREVCAAWAERAVSRHVSLGFDPSPQAAVVNGQPLLIRELFANLIDNAIRFTPAGGEVSVAVESASAPRVVIEDTGIGIPESERALVFERFYRVLGTGESGSGLGLSIVKAIAGLHGAEVTVGPGKQGKGTRFVVAF